AVTSTGYYPWTIDVQASFSDNTTVTHSITGNLPVVVRGSDSPYGYGWWVSGLDQLVSDSNGVLWVHGGGGADYFRSLSSGNFLSPSHDQGSLVQSQVDSTYTYTSPKQVKWYFDSGGALSKIVFPNTFTYTY